MFKLKRTLLVCIALILSIAIFAIAQEAPAEGARAGRGGMMGGRGGMGRGGGAVVSEELLEGADREVAPEGFDVEREGIARGNIVTVEYDSNSIGAKRKMNIYTPPGYSEDEEYPVFYLLHGMGDDHTGWQMKGSANVIFDNLYADKKLAPMIVVMPNGNATTETGGGGFGRGGGRGGAGGWGGWGEPFEKDLVESIIPYIEENYPVIADREHRTLAGLSMGGGQSLSMGLSHMDLFSAVGGFSSAPNLVPADQLITDPNEVKEKVKILWVSCGDSDGLMGNSSNFHTTLKEMEIPHIWHVDFGGHSWNVWKNDLYLLSQKLFQNDGSN